MQDLGASDLGQGHKKSMGNILDNVSRTVPSMVAAEAGQSGPSFLGLSVYVVILVAVMFGLMAIAKTGLNQRVFKSPLTSSFEQLYLFIENMCVGAMGSGGRKYIPMIISFWMIIFTANVIALFAPTSPTASLSFNLGMAVVVVFYVQWEGIRTNGFLGHISHFAGPKLAWPLLPITLMIFVIEIISEMMKNLSLTLRLFGNIRGGHLAVEAMNKLGDAFYVPFGTFLLPVKVLTCVVQALIFCVLTCVYLSLVTHHNAEEFAHDPDPASGPAH